MQRLYTYVLTIIVTGAATAIFAPEALHHSELDAADANDQTNAAFRDGLFLARLDAEQGRNPHLTSGRWSTDADRRLFVTAYLQAYREMRGDATLEQLSSPEPAVRRGYRDGLADGLQQRHESRSFQPSASENYRRADRGYSEIGGNQDQYKHAYRQAYCNGYQQAYYGQMEPIETANAQRRGGLD